MAENPDEPSIVRGLQQGDSDAWEALCQGYSVRLWRYVARLIGSDDAVISDVFQETMLAVAHAGRNLRSGSNIWSWLATIAHHQCALHWRKSDRTRTQSLCEVTCLADKPADDALEQRESIAFVRVALAELPPDYALVLTAKYTERLSSAEIAEGLGESVEAVRSRLARARREFRRRYESLTADSTKRVAEQTG